MPIFKKGSKEAIAWGLKMKKAKEAKKSMKGGSVEPINYDDKYLSSQRKSYLKQQTITTMTNDITSYTNNMNRYLRHPIRRGGGNGPFTWQQYIDMNDILNGMNFIKDQVILIEETEINERDFTSIINNFLRNFSVLKNNFDSILRNADTYIDNVSNPPRQQRLAGQGIKGGTIWETLYDLINPPDDFETWKKRQQGRRISKAEKDEIEALRQAKLLRQRAEEMEKEAKKSKERKIKSAKEYGEFEDITKEEATDFGKYKYITPQEAENITMAIEDIQSQILEEERKRLEEERKRLEKQLEEERKQLEKRLETEKIIKKEDPAWAFEDLEEEEAEGGAIKDWFSPLSWRKYATAIVSGANDYLPGVRALIQKYGNSRIVAMKACRTPLKSLLTSALNALSFGEFNKRFANYPHDKLFHLDLRITLDDGVVLTVEKNEQINIALGSKKISEGGSCSDIPIKQPITLNELLDGGKKMLGNKYFKYQAFNNNCQDYIVALLKGSSLGSTKNINFIKQSLKALFKGLPTLRKLTNTVTDIAGRVSTILRGAGAGASSTYKKPAFPDALRYIRDQAEEIIKKINTKEDIDNFIRDIKELVETQHVELFYGYDEYQKYKRAVIDIIELMGIDRKRQIDRIPSTLPEMSYDVEAGFLSHTIPLPVGVQLPVAEQIQNVNPRLLNIIERETHGGTIDDLSKEDNLAGEGIQKGENYYVQSIVFDKSKFDRKSASKWLRENNYVNKGVDEKEDTLRYRQVNPTYIKKMGFNRFRTKKIGKKSGISLIISYK